MKYLKSLALLLSLFTLASCSQGFEDFSEDIYTQNEIKDTKASEPNDSTGAGKISIHIDEPDVEDINYTVTLP